MRSSHGFAASVARPARTRSGTALGRVGRGSTVPLVPTASHLHQTLIGVQQAADVLARFERAEEQHVSVFRRGRPRRPVRRAVRTDGQSPGRDAELRLDFAGGEARGHEDAIRPLRVRARQRRIVAPHLRARALRMRQEIEVVDRDHLRRVPRRHQQRVRRMHHVEAPSGDRLRARPLEAMPREVEERHRHAAIDERDAGHVRRRNEPVLPRAGKERRLQLETRLGGGQGGECADELVRVFARAAPLPQRGTIVDQNAHLFKSF